MTKYLTIFLFSVVQNSTFSQDTLYWSEDSSTYFVESWDTVVKVHGTYSCWTRSEYVDDTLFTAEQLAEDKFHPKGIYRGYFKNGKMAFQRNYFFDGIDTEIHGLKAIYNLNSSEKETGQYHHGVKFGNWHYYNEEGEIVRWTQYDIPELDTISSLKFQAPYKGIISTDTIKHAEDISFTSTFPCLDFGKNGIEVLYQKGKPFEVRVYSKGVIVLTETKKSKMKKLINQAPILPSIILH